MTRCVDWNLGVWVLPDRYERRYGWLVLTRPNADSGLSGYDPGFLDEIQTRYTPDRFSD